MLGVGREPGGPLGELGVLAGPQRRVVRLAGERGDGAVERQQPGQHRGHLVVSQCLERAGGQGVAGVLDLAAAAGHVVDGPVEGGEVPAQAGSTLGGGEGRDPPDVARPDASSPSSRAKQYVV